MVRLWRLFVWFLWNYFSIPILTRTFFDPWKRAPERPDTTARFDMHVALWAAEVIMRAFGACMRFVVLAIGLGIVAWAIVLGPIAIFLWLILPFAVSALLFVGILLFIYAITR